MAFGRRRGRPNANGAGIAADPTLTGVWTSRSAWPFGLADFRRTFRRACFGGACLAPDVWPLRVRSCDPSHRDCSPALAPASGFRSCPLASFDRPESLPNSRCLAQSLGRDRVLLPIRACGGLELAFLSITRSGQVRGLSSGFSVAPASNEPACLWPKPPACPLSAGAWTIATAIFGIFPSELQCLAAFGSGWLVSRRQVQSAPQPAFWQHSEALVFHSRRFGLWTRVDKSTARRILRKSRKGRERNRLLSVRLSRDCRRYESGDSLFLR